MTSVEEVPSKPVKPETSEVEEKGTNEPKEDIQYPDVLKLSLITVALCSAVFCMSLDNTIIATAIPTITHQFQSIDDVGWYGSAYMLSVCSFQLIFGKLYTFLSIKWVYLSALFIFELGSFVCGIAPSSNALIVGRAVAGLGAAGLFSGAILIVSKSVPLHRRPTYVGLMGAMYGISSVVGPLLGGVFTDKVSWRWCFYINLPFGLVTAIFILFFFSNPGGQTAGPALGWKAKLKEFDILGTFLFLPAIICLLLALQWGGSRYAWSNGRIIALFVIFGVLIIAFAGVQIWKQDKGTVPPRVLKRRTIWAGAWFTFCLSASLYTIIYYLPIWFQAIKGASAVKSGIMNLPLILGMVTMGITSGVIVSALGYYAPVMIVSSVVSAIGVGLMTTFTPSTGHPKWIGYQVMVGMGAGLGMQQPMTAVQAALPMKDVPVGTSIMTFCQTMGGAVFVSVGQNVFQNQLRKNLMTSIPDVAPKIAALISQVGATGIHDAVSKQFPQSLNEVMSAYNDAVTQTWYVSVAMSSLNLFGAVFVEWLSVKKKK